MLSDPAPAPLGSYRVRRVGSDAGDVHLWQSYVASAPTATIYHDVAWRDIFGRSLGYRDFLLMAESSQGRVCGVLPLYLVPSVLGRPRLVSVPFRDRGGVVADNATVFRALIAEAQKVMTECHAAGLELKTIESYPHEEAQSLGLVCIKHWMHSRVDLAGLDGPRLEKRLGAKMRIVRQAERAGLTFSERGNDLGALELWYDIYQASQRNLGVPPFPKAFFREMMAAFVPSKQLELFVVSSPSGTPLAATIVLHDHQCSIYGYSASLPDRRHMRPNDFMLHELYLRMIAKGHTRFDFGADSPGQEGLLRFKRKWLANQSPIPYYYLGVGHPASTDSSSSRFDFTRRVVRSTPLPIARGVLAHLVRYFG